MPGYWRDAAAFVAERRERRLGDRAVEGGTAVTWVIPGAGFGIHEWGWTMEEVMQAVDRSPWVTRSQVPLTPAATIRMLTALETYLETGSGSPYLQAMLVRIGIDTVLVRHDLDSDVAVATPSNLVSVALARSPGLRRVKSFGGARLRPGDRGVRGAAQPRRGGERRVRRP
ncbi:alpha-(1-_3)-arabinofuranosyltransferase family protein [Nocardioides sp. TF02-7]|uniref:alpha-(1->3)-arabinofuranosyltransferase domain-containing protein n=1 Tax=Nocardioides sp. TF02-7 TaxID=2917724 RepID=UPI0023DBC156|nr:alpha-(1->3)-arabinofuranosyltransferase family protein [Nocardioides sp. TF02-7]